MVSTCPLHPDALPFERTMNGRLGCAPCLADPFNLDPRPLFEPLDVDGGETRCPTCHVGVQLRQSASGVLLAHDASGVHRHPLTFSVPIGQEARDGRRGKPLADTPTWERPDL